MSVNRFYFKYFRSNWEHPGQGQMGQGRPWMMDQGGGMMGGNNWNGMQGGGGNWNDNDADKHTPFTDMTHFDVSKECAPEDWTKALPRNPKLERYVLCLILKAGNQNNSLC